MKNYLVFSCLFACLFNVGIMGQSKKLATDLPDISVIGNIVGVHSDHQKSLDLKEIELSFQHYLYPTVKADVFLALHKDESGKRHLELEEGFITFSDLIGVISPSHLGQYGLEAIVGHKRVGIGKLNVLHPEQWNFVDRSFALGHVLGGGEGLAAEGVQLSHLLPVPFFSQLEVGVWTLAKHAHGEDAGHDEDEDEHHEEEASHGVEYENRLISARLWNSFSLSSHQELEFGLNFLKGNVTAAQDDQQELMGFDVTFLQDLDMGRSLKLQMEYYQAKYGEEEGDHGRESQNAGYFTLLYDLNPTYQTGLRYSLLGKHGDEGKEINQLSLMLTRQLTETSKFRLQYNTSEDHDDQILAQFVFGMGPHAHVLQ